MDVVAQPYNPRTWEVEGGYQIHGQPWLHSETLTKKPASRQLEWGCGCRGGFEEGSSAPAKWLGVRDEPRGLGDSVQWVDRYSK